MYYELLNDLVTSSLTLLANHYSLDILINYQLINYSLLLSLIGQLPFAVEAKNRNSDSNEK